MKTRLMMLAVPMFVLLLTGVGGDVYGQRARTSITGTVLSYGTGLNTRARTANFTLYINALTPEAETDRLLNVLQRGGQDDLLRAIQNSNVGNFSIGAQVGRTINIARVEDIDGKRRIRLIFERWLGVSELRTGHRSVDYPFSYIELFIDPRTGKGEGTYIAAARIRFKNDQVEVEDFGTFPSRLMNVKVRSAGSFL